MGNQLVILETGQGLQITSIIAVARSHQLPGIASWLHSITPPLPREARIPWQFRQTIFPQLRAWGALKKLLAAAGLGRITGLPEAVPVVA